MDQAITRAAGAAPRVVGEFQGYVDGVDGIKPSVRWLDRKNMPQVGDRLFAIPAGAAVPRSWAVLLTSENHGTVGPVGCTFPWAGEKHERIQVMEIVEAGSPPAPGVDLGGLVRLDAADILPGSGAAGSVLTDERAAFERHERKSNLRRVGVGHDGSGGWYENPCVQSAWEGWQARATLTSRPAEVDDEGPPALPSPEFCAGDLEIGEPVYTAEQYRQGQRDAVAADRARRAAAGGGQ